MIDLEPSRLAAIYRWAECGSNSTEKKKKKKTNTVPECFAKLPVSQCVGVALSPNSVINNRAGKTRPLRRQIREWMPPALPGIAVRRGRTSTRVTLDDWQEERAEQQWGGNIRQKPKRPAWFETMLCFYWGDSCLSCCKEGVLVSVPLLATDSPSEG